LSIAQTHEPGAASVLNTQTDHQPVFVKTIDLNNRTRPCLGGQWLRPITPETQHLIEIKPLGPAKIYVEYPGNFYRTAFIIEGGLLDLTRDVLPDAVDFSGWEKPMNVDYLVRKFLEGCTA
jgi:hypothetical protein